MTAAQELASLESAYEAWIKAGCPQSYTHEGRTVTKASAEWMSKRIDDLRAVVARQTAGGFLGVRFRPDN